MPQTTGAGDRRGGGGGGTGAGGAFPTTIASYPDYGSAGPAQSRVPPPGPAGRTDGNLGNHQQPDFNREHQFHPQQPQQPAGTFVRPVKVGVSGTFFYFFIFLSACKFFDTLYYHKIKNMLTNPTKQNKKMTNIVKIEKKTSFLNVSWGLKMVAVA